MLCKEQTPSPCKNAVQAQNIFVLTSNGRVFALILSILPFTQLQCYTDSKFFVLKSNGHV